MVAIVYILTYLLYFYYILYFSMQLLHVIVLIIQTSESHTFGGF